MDMAMDDWPIVSPEPRKAELGMTNIHTGHMHARAVSRVKSRRISPNPPYKLVHNEYPPTKRSIRLAFPSLSRVLGVEFWTCYSKLSAFPTLNPWTRSRILDSVL